MKDLARLLTALGYIVARTPYYLTAHRAAVHSGGIPCRHPQKNLQTITICYNFAT